ncbi:hypothetical protein F2Q69_00030070 [Brassica cretica]|uniref:Uncharacterized protein n=1 Tax=Brassica cretica TaxID=69181 RepID=A0A8S9RSV9_BRACR|nr:hypothetical protein F2Q69_00030070 [Brassica cretica]
MSRDIGELSESDEGEPDLSREEPDLSREETNELASLWSGPTIRGNLVSLSSKPSLSPFHSFRETSIVQQSASSLHGQPSFIPIQVIQEQKPYPGCTKWYQSHLKVRVCDLSSQIIQSIKHFSYLFIC